MFIFYQYMILSKSKFYVLLVWYKKLIWGHQLQMLLCWSRQFSFSHLPYLSISHFLYFSFIVSAPFTLLSLSLHVTFFPLNLFD